MLTLPAYAKINLVLEILGERGDGYREVSTVMQSIDLVDTLSFELSDGLELRCDNPDLVSSDNAVLKAARLLQEKMRCDEGAVIYLDKRIPIGAGVGGHSADEAAALKGLNELWGLGLPQHMLVELAYELSSDTSFFLYGGTALAQGRGERVTPLPPIPQAWVVLLKPDVGYIPNKTARVCGSLSPSRFSSGELTQRFIEHLRQGKPIDTSLLFNVFEFVAFDFFPQLHWHRSRFLAAGAVDVRLTGGGPALFSLVWDRASGEAIFQRLKDEGYEVYVVRTMSAEPLP
jgi:4-diphosphocytidyl-2-C-methyl-D-erythritol kinase